jgi:hypothetical protein
LEVVTVSVELSGPEASRPHIERAAPEHPSLLDPRHSMDALFGVVNIPNVVWIDERGVIVRPPEPGWPGGRHELPDDMRGVLGRLGRAETAPEPPEGRGGMVALSGGQDRDGYADAIRDWVDHGSESVYALSPDEVVARSQPRSLAASEGAAHFELAEHLWQDGRRELAIAHFKECHRLQPDNWTYKRQAWSLIGNERSPGEFGRFSQGPLKGEEANWPFESEFLSDVGLLGVGEYYPKTI